MYLRILFLLTFSLCLCALPSRGERIRFFSAADQVNLTSTGGLMDSSFVFELGVFTGGFAPTENNTAEWAAHWQPAKDPAGKSARVSYDAKHGRIDSELVVANHRNAIPQGTQGYLWGFTTSGTNTEWILLRNDSWRWPAANPLNPLPPEWNLAEATVIVGNVNPQGSPYLMKSEAVSTTSSPTTEWSQWQSQYLSAESAQGPGDDPDGDGSSNLIEYVFNMDPNEAESPPSMQIELVQVANQRFLTVRIPRHARRIAALDVEVSSDLKSWESGPGHTATVAESPTEWIVRDLTPISAESPRRFLRLKASLP